jgi:hypothetical protein
VAFTSSAVARRSFYSPAGEQPVKSPKHAKITHYSDNSQPWNKGPKLKKSKKPVIIGTVHDEVIIDTETLASLKEYQKDIHKHIVMMYGGTGMGKAMLYHEPETVELWTAKSLNPDVMYPSHKVQTVEGVKVVVSKKRIPKEPEKGLWYHDFQPQSLMDYAYGIGFFMPRNRRDDLTKRVTEFLEKPLPEPEKTRIILPKEFEDARRREFQKDAMVSFLEAEVDYQLEPMKADADRLRNTITSQANRITELQNKLDALEALSDKQCKELSDLQVYKSRVQVATVHTGERIRHFRAED